MKTMCEAIIDNPFWPIFLSLSYSFQAGMCFLCLSFEPCNDPISWLRSVVMLQCCVTIGALSCLVCLFFDLVVLTLVEKHVVFGGSRAVRFDNGMS